MRPFSPSPSKFPTLLALTYILSGCGPATGASENASNPEDSGLNLCAAPPCSNGTGASSAEGGASGNTAPGGNLNTGGSTQQGAGGSGASVGLPTGGISATGGNSPGGDIETCDRKVDTSTYNYDANIPPSPLPPGGLAVRDTPLFVSLGVDDNFEVQGIDWLVSQHTALDAKFSLFSNSVHVATSGDSWSRAASAGMEIGLHLHDHKRGRFFDAGAWSTQIAKNMSQLTGKGLPRQFGFRSPFLEYNDELFTVLKQKSIWYDCSIEEGYQPSMDASNYSYPYTLDGGSPAHDYIRSQGVPTRNFTLGSHPGVFELPAYALFVPPESEAPGLRSKVENAPVPDFKKFGYKITGFDWNLWDSAKLTGSEVLTILKYNLDQRLAGNRAPFLFGAHPVNYQNNNIERRKAISDFLTYASSFDEVRIVTHKEIVDFMREPKPLKCY